MGLTFGLGLYTGQRPPGALEGPLYRDAIALAEAAEAAGFDAFWVSEHHGFADRYLPSPLTVLAAIAARTERIRLGAGIVIAPFAHPVHLAEDAAVVDQLSNGRLILGLGLGYADHEYRTFNVARASRGAALRDLVAFLRTAWRGAEFDWDGPCYRGTGLRVTPTPVGGSIPVWLGGYADAAIRRAARIGDGYLLGRADDNIVAAVAELLAAEHDPPRSAFTVGLNVLTVFADDGRDSLAARVGLAYQQSVYEAVQVGGIAHAGRVTTASAAISADTVLDYVHAYGDPAQIVAQVVRKLEMLPRFSDVHLVLRALFPERDVGLQLARVQRLGQSVLPAIRSALPHLSGVAA